MVNGTIRAQLAVQRAKRNFNISTNTSFLLVVFIWGVVSVLVACEFFCVYCISSHVKERSGCGGQGRGRGDGCCSVGTVSTWRVKGLAEVDGAVFAQQCKLLKATALQPVKTVDVCYVCFAVFKRWARVRHTEKSHGAGMYGQKNMNSLYCRAVGFKGIAYGFLHIFLCYLKTWTRPCIGLLKKKKKNLYTNSEN